MLLIVSAKHRLIGNRRQVVAARASTIGPRAVRAYSAPAPYLHAFDNAPRNGFRPVLGLLGIIPMGIVPRSGATLAGDGAIAAHFSSVASWAASFSRRGGGLFFASHGCQAISSRNVSQAASASAEIASSQGRRRNGRGSSWLWKAGSLAWRAGEAGVWLAAGRFWFVIGIGARASARKRGNVARARATVA